MKVKEADRIVIDTLGLEVTRMCNMSCVHCLRGDSQNLYMSQEIFDEFFEYYKNNNIQISILLLTGGEPFLNKELIKYILGKFIHHYKGQTSEHKRYLPSIDITTNGSLIDMELLLLFNKYTLLSTGERTILEDYIRVSNDIFHDHKLQTEVENLLAFRGVYLGTTYYKKIIPEGNAEHINPNDYDAEFDYDAIKSYDPYKKYYDFDEEYNEVEYNQLIITTNGKIVNSCNLSYDHEDEYSQYKSFKELMDQELNKEN